MASRDNRVETYIGLVAIVCAVVFFTAWGFGDKIARLSGPIFFVLIIIAGVVAAFYWSAQARHAARRRAPQRTSEQLYEDIRPERPHSLDASIRTIRDQLEKRDD